MGHTDVSGTLLDGMKSALDVWASRFDGEQDPLYWVLRFKAANANGGLGQGARGAKSSDIPAGIRGEVAARIKSDAAYWDNVRYAGLDPVTQLWGAVVNAIRVAADSEMSTERQRAVFDYEAESLVAFLRSARARMEVADQLYHAFKPMPAPECQALAALLNVHIDAHLDVDTMCRLVRLLDQEGPLTAEESDALAALSNTGLVDAAFRGLRGEA